jgi:hypothetical protein
MNYTDLKDGKKVNVYIPAMNRFYKMDVTFRAGDELGGFSISNYGSKKTNLIDGHEFLGIVRNQEDVDNFFYMQKEAVTGKEGDLSFEKADAHFAKNGKSWIF